MDHQPLPRMPVRHGIPKGGYHTTFDKLSEEFFAIYGILAFSGFDAPTNEEIVS
jgi:hypothetical protein